MRGFDYSTPGCYFVTINTRNPGSWFGTVNVGRLIPNDAGVMVRTVWQKVPLWLPGVMMDQVVVMPDHVHGIVMLGADPDVPARYTLSEVIGAFKSVSAREYGIGVREAGWRPYDVHFWHRSFRDTIIRTEVSLNAFQAYIEGNPGRWSEKYGR